MTVADNISGKSIVIRKDHKHSSCPTESSFGLIGEVLSPSIIHRFVCVVIMILECNYSVGKEIYSSLNGHLVLWLHPQLSHSIGEKLWKRSEDFFLARTSFHSCHPIVAFDSSPSSSSPLTIVCKSQYKTFQVYFF